MPTLLYVGGCCVAVCRRIDCWGRTMNGVDPRILQVFREAKQCTNCFPGGRLHVPLPDEKNGSAGAKVMFVFDRPGRIGTVKTDRISFDNPDPTAEFFKELIGQIRVPREDIFITNAVLCHRLGPGALDTQPRSKEILNCSGFLRRQLEIVGPLLLVPLGNTALRALKLLFPDSSQLRRFKLKDDIGQVIRDAPCLVYPVYHTSLKARVTRPAESQKRDWSAIPSLLQEAVG